MVMLVLARNTNSKQRLHKMICNILKNFIKIISFNKTNNFDKKYKATRTNANKYSVDKWNR